MKIVIGFSRSRSFWKLGSKAIQISEKRNFGHAYIKIHCPITDKPLIAQASHGSVNMMALPIFLQNNIVVKEYEIDCTSEEFKDLMGFVCDNLGVPYSQMQIIEIAIKKVLHLEIKSYNKDKYFICSEFAARACQIIKIEMPNTNLDYFTPSNLEVVLAEAVTSKNQRIKLLDC
jgi:hypothetical protein